MRSCFFLLVAFLSAASAFVAQAPLRAAVEPRAAVTTMGAAKDGPFTPAVLAAKVVLGEKTLGKVRGKAIAYHSQEINKFCEEYGVPKKLNQALIKKAKVVGSDLGFLS